MVKWDLVDSYCGLRTARHRFHAWMKLKDDELYQTRSVSYVPWFSTSACSERRHYPGAIGLSPPCMTILSTSEIRMTDFQPRTWMGMSVDTQICSAG